MDRFEDYLKKKSKQETENFKLPKSFDDKVEDSLLNLDNISSKNKWYKNKKVWITAACFMFICTTVISLKENSSLSRNLKNSVNSNSRNQGNESSIVAYDSPITEKNEESKIIEENNFIDKIETNDFIDNEKDVIIKNAYESLDDYSKTSILKWKDAEVENFKIDKKYLIFSKGKTIDISGIDTYKVTFRTKDDDVLGPISVYIDIKNLEVLGADSRD